ncbi:MAG: hypothetical protein KAH32_03210 [Chlamydiia bacterium]|nr:hypothetical protein [Chlamydiia bacterium]
MLTINKTINLLKRRDVRITSSVFLCVSAMYAYFGKISRLSKILFENIYTFVFPSFLKSIVSGRKLPSLTSIMNNKFKIIYAACCIYAFYDIAKMILSRIVKFSKKINMMFRSPEKKALFKQNEFLAECNSTIASYDKKISVRDKARAVIGKFLMMTTVKIYNSYILSSEFRDVDMYMASSNKEANDRMNVSHSKVFQYLGISLGASALAACMPSVKESLEDNTSIKSVFNSKNLARMMSTHCFSMVISSVMTDGVITAIIRNMKYKDIIYNDTPMNILSVIRNIMTMCFNQTVVDMLLSEVQDIVLSASLITNEIRLFRMKEL